MGQAPAPRRHGNQISVRGCRAKPDLAVFDVRLARGERGPEIARRLNSRGKFGVLFATGDGARISTR